MVNRVQTVSSRLHLSSKRTRCALGSIHPDLGPVDVERWDSIGHVPLLRVRREFSIHFEEDGSWNSQL
jgi:hypothetical protein